MSRFINNSDDEVFDFLTRRTVAPGESLNVPDADDECYEEHPVWTPIVALGSQSKREKKQPDGDQSDDDSQKEE